MIYKRTSQTIERAKGAAASSVSGILASDGEASDSHILNIDGGRTPEGSPMLFGHDDFSGSRNLGSWDRFERFSSAAGGRALRAHGTIALGGDGAGKAWRNDVAYMVGERHITGLSIRWEPTDDPIARTSLPSDHPAYVDRKDKRARGLFFPAWDMMEGSVVTMPADQGAVIGRMATAEPEVRAFYREALNDAIAQEAGAGELVAVDLGSDEFAHIERRVYDAMLELANERYSLALDLYERAMLTLDPPEPMTIEEIAQTPEFQDPPGQDSSAQAADLQKEREPEAASLPAVTARMLFGVLQERLATSSDEAKKANSAAWKRAGGKI